MRVGSALLIDRAAKASSLADVVSTGPVLVVFVNDNELTVGLGDGFIEAGSSYADVEVFVVDVELGGERHFIFVVFVGGKIDPAADAGNVGGADCGFTSDFPLALDRFALELSASGDFPVSIVNESLVIGAVEFLRLEGEGGLDLVSIDVITNLGPGLIGVSLSVILLVDFLGEATFNVQIFLGGGLEGEFPEIKSC